MLFAKWSERSLRSWVAIGMTLAVLPILASGLVDHLMLEKGVIADLRDVAARQRDQIDPAQQLRIALWEAAVPLNEYLDTHQAREVGAYRAQRILIEAGFAKLHEQLSSDHELRGLLERAADDWRAADGVASDLLSTTSNAGDPHAIEQADRFDARIASSVDELRAVYRNLDRELQQDHAAALLSYERSQWVSGIAAAVSLSLMLLGIAVIGRIMVNNVERLIDGARKFAAGDREHRIEVQVPPELRRVADEFNNMIARIRVSEAALADEAREDALTGLPNRRAFEEALREAFARLRRMGEGVHLLMLDIDHFKSVNDTHGHAGGDEVLRSIGKTIASTTREVDKAFRIGGEEFAVLLIATDLEGARIAGERLRAAIAARPVVTARAEVPVTASIGIAPANSAMHPAELLEAADTALYAAKSSGRNRVVVANSSGAGGTSAGALGTSGQAPA
jgi:diguanylate cyclase (GGDEF)-like protein